VKLLINRSAIDYARVSKLNVAPRRGHFKWVVVEPVDPGGLDEVMRAFELRDSIDAGDINLLEDLPIPPLFRRPRLKN